MGRSVVIVVSEDATLVQKVKTLGLENGVTVQSFGSKTWSEGLEDPNFRRNVATEPVAQTSAHAKILPFPQPHANPNLNGGSKKVSTINEMESEAIVKAIVEYRGNLTEAAKALGIGRATIYRKIKQYNIDPNVGRNKQAA